MKKNWKLLFAMFCVLALTGILLLRVLERVMVEEYKPPSKEAQRNDFLAAQRTLDRLKVRWENFDGVITELPNGAGVTVILPNAGGRLNELSLAAIEAFVSSGGHLITVPGWWGDNELLAKFGVSREYDYDEDEDEEDEDEDEDTEPNASNDLIKGDRVAADTATDTDTGDSLADVDAGQPEAVPPTSSSDSILEDIESIDSDDDELPNFGEGCACAGHADDDHSHHQRSGDLLGEPELRMLIHDEAWLVSTSKVLGKIGPAGRPQLLHLKHGAGHVTAMVDFGPFENDHLGDADNAEALLRLINLPQPAQRVIFVRARVSGLADWLLSYGWRVIAVGSVLLALLLWAAMPRFGPLMADPLPQRRRLLDHLLASGRLLWSNGQGGVLAAAAASSALDRVRSEYPHTRWLAAEELALFVQRRFALDASVVGLLLAPMQVRHPVSLTALVRACQRIHTELAPRRSARSVNPLYDC